MLQGSSPPPSPSAADLSPFVPCSISLLRRIGATTDNRSVIALATARSPQRVPRLAGATAASSICAVNNFLFYYEPAATAEPTTAQPAAAAKPTAAQPAAVAKPSASEPAAAEPTTAKLAAATKPAATAVPTAAQPAATAKPSASEPAAEPSASEPTIAVPVGHPLFRSAPYPRSHHRSILLRNHHIHGYIRRCRL